MKCCKTFRLLSTRMLCRLCTGAKSFQPFPNRKNYTCERLKPFIALLVTLFVLLAYTAKPITAAPSKNTFGYTDQTIFALGGGYNSNDLTEKLGKCVEWTPLFTGGSHSDVILEVLRNSSALKDIQHVDVQVEAHFVVGSASSKFTQDSASTNDDSSLSLVYHAYSQRPSEEFATDKLDSNHINKPRADLIQQCGDRIVSKVDLEQSADILITISNADQTVRHNMLASVSGGASFGPVSASLMATLSTEMNRANSEHRVKATIASAGDPGFGASADLQEAVLKDNVSLTELGTALKTFVKKFDEKDAAGNYIAMPRPIRFYTTVMPGLASTDDPWTDAKERALFKLASAYRGASLLATEIAGLLKPEPDPRVENMSATAITAIAALEPNISAYAGALATAHSACRRFEATLTDCSMPPCPQNIAQICGTDGNLARPVEMPIAYHPTFASFRVIVDGVLEPASTSYEIFALPRDSFVNHIHRYYRKATSAYGVVLLDSPYMSFAQSQIVISGCTDSAKIYYCSHDSPVGRTYNGQTFFTRLNPPALFNAAGIAGKTVIVFEGFNPTAPFGSGLESKCSRAGGEDESMLCLNFVNREFGSVSPRSCPSQIVSAGGLVTYLGVKCEYPVKAYSALGFTTAAAMTEDLVIAVKDRISPIPALIKVAERTYHIIWSPSTVSENFFDRQYTGEALP